MPNDFNLEIKKKALEIKDRVPILSPTSHLWDWATEIMVDVKLSEAVRPSIDRPSVVRIVPNY